MDSVQVNRYLKSLKRFGIRLGLDRVECLLSLLSNPHSRLRCIHVAGTNGKGSVCAYLNSILLEVGFNVGLYTSPHLYRLNERIKVNGKMISDKDLVRLVSVVKPFADKVSRETGELTFFEVTTAIAFLYFAEKDVDFVVLETGLGGRLDATNLIENPLVSVITNVSREHTEFLGSRLEEIAGEKASIIKENSLVATAASGKALEVIEKACRENKAILCVVGDEVSFERISCSLNEQQFTLTFFGKQYRLSIKLLGRHQLYNAALAFSVVDMLKTFHKLKIMEEDVEKGLRKTKMPCRLELVQKKPLVFLDGAHNPDGVKKLAEALTDMPHEKILLVFGCSFNKEYRKMILAIAPKVDTVFVTETKLVRPLEAERLRQEFRKHAKSVTLEKDVKKAVKKALSKASPKDLVLVTGSLYVAGEARKIWHKKP